MAGFNKAVLAAFGLGAAAGIVAGCQVYDFEPVVPLTLQQESEEVQVTARGLKPNLMLLVDKSGSMDIAADRTVPSCMLADSGVCGRPGATACPGTCPTRWTELQGAMEEFLTNSGDVARMGLAVYPNNIICGRTDNDAGPMDVATPLNQAEDSDSASRIATANEINNRLQEITAAQTAGGTPTGTAIRRLIELPELKQDDGREDFILVLTDGLPNCNYDSEVDPNDEAACRCTGVCTGSSTAYLNCLDKDGTVSAIQTALSRNIKTIVVGFGDETAGGDGPEVLNAMAAAGGFPRRCNTDGGSPACAAGDTCGPNGICNNIKYYQATSRTELAEQLAAISGIIDAEPCLFNVTLDPPNFDSRFVVVYITQPGQPTQKLYAGPDTFSYSPGRVELLGPTCQLAMGSTPQNPVFVEIRILSTL